MSVKVLDDNGFGDWAIIANGVVWASDNGADIKTIVAQNYRFNEERDSVENEIVYDFVSSDNQLNLGYSNRIGGGSFSNLFLDEISILEIALEQNQIQTILESDLLGE